jgi:hypothetical protein
LKNARAEVVIWVSETRTEKSRAEKKLKVNTRKKRRLKQKLEYERKSMKIK